MADSVSSSFDSNVKAYESEAQHIVETLAGELEYLATRLRLLATGFASDRVLAVDLAADITNEYTQQAGRGGSRLGDMTRTAGKADRAKAVAETLKGFAEESE
jgi:hypothetical protein